MQRFSVLLVAAFTLALLLTGIGLAKTSRVESNPEPTATLVPRPTAMPSPMPTLPSTPTPSPTSTLKPTTTPKPTIMPSPTPSINVTTYPSNEMGDVLILVYHAIGHPEDRWRRTPENLRADLDYLLAHGYYPVNLIDVARGNLDHVPRGRRPVVLTFDDSSSGQFRYLEDGSVDPDCAVGVLLAMHEEYGENWPLRATFFVLLRNANEPGEPLFRQPDSAAKKVRALIDWGMEVGGHTITHPDFSQTDAETIKWELAVSQNRIENLIAEYSVRSLALPFGSYPGDVTLLEAGYSESAGLAYQYEAVVRLGAKPAPSPFSPDFDPFFIPRVQTVQSQLDLWFSYYEQHPERYYVSDGGE